MAQSRRDDFGPDFHDRLSKYWPVPREQLHHGGWQATQWLFDLINPTKNMTLLDLCCGEGGTVHWAAQNYDVTVIGLDIVEKAIVTANANSSPATEFCVADGFFIPLKADTIDVIFGQDPDVFGYDTREQAFAECFRVLLPEGKMFFHHYVIHDDAPDKVKLQFNNINAQVGFEAFNRLSIQEYSDDLAQAGFEVLAVHDMSSTYQQHISDMKAIAQSHGEELDKWTSFVLDLMQEGHKIGALFEVKKHN